MDRGRDSVNCPSGESRTARTVLSPEEWTAEWRALVKGQPVRSVIADDSRESIYEERGE